MSQREFERQAIRRERAQARRTTLRRRRAGLAAGAVGAAVLFAPSAANAATFEVNTLADSNGSGTCAPATDCTLRDAVTLANSNADADTITFAASLTQAADPTIYLANGQLLVTAGPVTITGPGADALAISGKDGPQAQPVSRIFSISGSGDLRLSGLTLSDGNGTGGGITNTGGAILTTGKLTLTDSIVTENSAYGGQNGLGAGGGLSVRGGQATVEGSEFTKNDVSGRTGTGGGIANENGALTVRDSTVTDNNASGETAYGGGITAASTTTIQSSNVDENTAWAYDGSFGGGIATGSELKYPDDRARGATSRQVLITDSTVSDNSAAVGGGISSDFSLDKTADGVTIVRSTIDNNRAEEAGGGISVENQDDGNDYTVRESTVSNNRVEREVPSRAADTVLNGTGGGIELGSESAGDTLVSNSTISGNAAEDGGGIHAGAPNVKVRKAPEADTTPEPRGTTTAEEPPPTPLTGSVVVANTTVAANDASGTGGGVLVQPGVTDQASAKLSSTIVGNNDAGGAANDLATQGGEALDAGYSLIEVPGTASVNAIGGQPNVNGKDPALGALTNNGGPTETHLLAGSSPAVDAGTGNGLSTDQRGLPRTQDRLVPNVSDGTDIGAVEIPGETPVTPGRPVTPSATPTICGRRAISLVRADIKGNKVKLTGLVGSRFYGKTVTIQTDPKGARSSKFTKTGTVKASRTGSFTVSVPKPAKDDLVSVRYRAVIGSAKSPALKLPQSLTSRSVKSAKGTITVKGKVKLSVLGKRNKVKIRRLVCGRYRTVGTAKPDAKGNYTVTFKSTSIRGVAFYRAESMVLRKPGSKVYVIQYARAIAIRTTSQTG